MRIKFSLFIFAAILSLTSLTFSQNKNANRKSQTVDQTVNCKSNEFSFPCPKEYKIVLNGTGSTGLFLAKNLEFDYSVFVVAHESSVDKEKLLTEVTTTILKTLYPKDSQVYRWKDVEFQNNKATSKFETRKKLSLGFNENQLVTVDYGHISFKNKNLIAGTIVVGFFKGEAAVGDFELGRYTTNGGCSDAVKIIHTFTGEKGSEELNPCGFTIIQKAN
jgi:hypothetical protein